MGVWVGAYHGKHTKCQKEHSNVRFFVPFQRKKKKKTTVEGLYSLFSWLGYKGRQTRRAQAKPSVLSRVAWASVGGQLSPLVSSPTAAAKAPNRCRDMRDLHEQQQ